MNFRCVFNDSSLGLVDTSQEKYTWDSTIMYLKYFWYELLCWTPQKRMYWIWRTMKVVQTYIQVHSVNGGINWTLQCQDVLNKLARENECVNRRLIVLIGGNRHFALLPKNVGLREGGLASVRLILEHLIFMQLEPVR